MTLPGTNIPDIPIPQDMLPKPPSAPKTGYEVLKPFLFQQGREPDRVLGDGNCLFRALSRALTGVEDHHIALRKTIAVFEASNTTVFQPLHSAINQTPAIPFSDHLRNIRKLSVWGTNLEIIAAASLFQLDIYLATETYHLGVPTWLLYPPKPMFTLSNRELKGRLSDKVNVTGGWIELLHVTNSHFDSIKPLPGHCHKLVRPHLLPNNTQDEIIILDK